jgi:hypothetical protein
MHWYILVSIFAADLLRCAITRDKYGFFSWLFTFLAWLILLAKAGKIPLVFL